MSFNQIPSKIKFIKFFENDLETIIIDYIKASGITILPLAVRAMVDFMTSGTLESSAKIFFSDKDILITLVSVVSSSAFISYRYLNRQRKEVLLE